jgi:hypothetical protein
MPFLMILLAVLAVSGIIGTVILVARDGHRAVPTCDHSTMM